jgi:hypothetical protein
MNARRLRVVLAAAGLAGALALPAAALASGSTVMYDARSSTGWNDPLVAPGRVYISGDGSLFVGSLRWSRWTGGYAYGRGIRWRDNCIPNCAQGTYLKSPASLTMWDVLSHNGQRYFARMTLRWTTRDGVHRKHRYSYSISGGTVPYWH